MKVTKRKFEIFEDNDLADIPRATRNFEKVEAELDEVDTRIDEVKKSGVESNKTLVEALNSKKVAASTDDSIKTNVNKVNDIVTDPSGNTTAIASDLSKGKTAYSKNKLITGTMPQFTNYDKTISNVGGVITIPKGEQTRDFKIKTDIEEGYKEGDILDKMEIMQNEGFSIKQSNFAFSGIESDQKYEDEMQPILSFSEGVLFFRRNATASGIRGRVYFLDYLHTLQWMVEPTSSGYVIYDAPKAVYDFDGHIILILDRILTKINIKTGNIIWEIKREKDTTSIHFDDRLECLVVTDYGTGLVNVYDNNGVKSLDVNANVHPSYKVRGSVLGWAVFQGRGEGLGRPVNIITGETGFQCIGSGAEHSISAYCIPDNDSLLVIETSRGVYLANAIVEQADDITGTYKKQLRFKEMSRVVKHAYGTGNRSQSFMYMYETYLQNNRFPFLSYFDIPDDRFFNGTGIIEVVENRHLVMHFNTNFVDPGENNKNQLSYNGKYFYTRSRIDSVRTFWVIEETYKIKKGKGSR